MSKISTFKGLNNVTDPLRLGLSWLAQADNVNITDTGAIKKRSGYSKAFSGAITSAYSTLDFTRCFVVDGGTLKAMTGPTAAVELLTSLSDAPMHFTEVNDQVFFNNGTDSGIIQPDNTVIDWEWPAPLAPALRAVTGSLPAGLYRACCTFVLPDGRETGSSESVELTLGEGAALQISGISQLNGCITRTYISPADSTVLQLAHQSGESVFTWSYSPDNLGVDLLNYAMNPIPADSSVIQHWKGRIYVAHHMAQDNQTVLWFSQPMGFHLFDLAQDFILIPGRITMLAPHDDALIVGTDTRIYAYNGEKLDQLAPYGVIPGQHWAKDDGRLLFWTAHGLCASPPFVNLTERQISVPPGLSAGGALLLQGGHKRYLVSLQSGGQAFNPLT